MTRIADFPLRTKLLLHGFGHSECFPIWALKAAEPVNSCYPFYFIRKCVKGLCLKIGVGMMLRVFAMGETFK